MDTIRVESAYFDKVFDLGNSDTGSRGHDGIEVPRCLAIQRLPHLSPFHALTKAKSAFNARSNTYVQPSNSRVSFPSATTVPKPVGVKNPAIPAPPALMRSANVP